MVAPTQENRIKEIITFLLPYLIPAGRYATYIQRNVKSQSDKCSAEENAFTAALTDADISIQNFFEILLLSRFPDVDFFGEEAASSNNMKYFSKREGIKILLDPIDGTLLYKNNSPLFSIIFTFCSESHFLGNIIFEPSIKRCFVCIRGKGTYDLHPSEMQSATLSRSITLKSDINKIVMYRCGKLRDALAPHYQVYDLACDYDASPDWPHTFAGILRGEQCAILTSHPQLIDSASIAFAVRESGGYVCDFSGVPIVDSEGFASGLYDTLIAASSEKIAQDILASIETAGSVPTRG